MRTEWVAKRKNDSNRTQMHYARQGVITEEMIYIARRENEPALYQLNAKAINDLRSAAGKVNQAPSSPKQK